MRSRAPSPDLFRYSRVALLSYRLFYASLSFSVLSLVRRFWAYATRSTRQPLPPYTVRRWDTPLALLMKLLRARMSGYRQSASKH